MGYLKDIHSNLDIQAFPGAHFEIVGDVPAPQCSEAKIEGDDATTLFDLYGELADPGKFAGWDLKDKILTITASTGGNTGDFIISTTTDNVITFPGNCGDGTEVEYFIHNGGELILTRNVKSFAQFIHAAGYAYTIKGGKLYTNMPSGLLKEACTILFDPLT